jgi:pyridoxal phosphate enzyme (YggS family)
MAEAGQSVFGENRVQVALAKMGEVGPARWHLVGHLQRNKARHAVGAFDLIHAVDDLELAREIDRRAAARSFVQPVLVEVNVAGEDTKEGVAVDALPRLLEDMVPLPSLDLQGLMAIPPPAGDPEASRPWFRELARLRDASARRLGRPLPHLSMGMSDDFEVAIEEGATLVRVGRALFGERLP